MTEPIVIILQTFERTDCALRTIAAARANLRYGGDILWYIADDSRNTEHGAAIRDALADASVIGGHHLPGVTYGENANAAWAAASKHSMLSLWLEDDWELREPLDLYTYACLLMERDDIGMVRLGYITPALFTTSFEHRLPYWHLDRTPPNTSRYAFTGHPSLRHVRYWRTYGDYPIGLGPGDTELAYAYQYRTGNGPAIVWPAGYPLDGMWAHIGTVKTETMV